MVKAASIELALSHKHGLSLRYPVILGAGFGGYAAEYTGALDYTRLGALVTVPTTLRPRVGRRQPRALDIPGGVLISRDGANPGLPAVVRANRRVWRGLPFPLILSLAAEGMPEWPSLARRVQGLGMAQALELEIIEEAEVREVVRAVHQSAQLPLICRIPLASAVSSAEGCAAGGASALVIGLPPRADAVGSDGGLWKGRLYGPAVFPLVLRAVRKVKEAGIGLPIVAGSVHSLEQARVLLAAGASAVQLDTLLMLDPRLAAEIILELGSGGGESI